MDKLPWSFLIYIGTYALSDYAITTAYKVFSTQYPPSQNHKILSIVINNKLTAANL